MHPTRLLLVSAVSLLMACQQDTSPGSVAAIRQAAAAPASPLSGQTLFLKHCASCHGEQAQGAPDWHKVRPDGSWPPPPLNGTAHSWHHPHAVLMDVIRNGSTDSGGKMPAWKDKLGDREIESIISWFQSLWPAEILKTWQEMDTRAKQPSSP